MKIDYWIQFIAIALAVAAFLLKFKGMKKYIPLALFGIVYTNILCYFADYLKLWNFPVKIIPSAAVSIPFNYFVIPVLIIYWRRFCPVNTAYRFFWTLGWSIVIIAAEYILTRFTNILSFTNGFDIHISFLLWMGSFYIFYIFHSWIVGNYDAA